MLSAAFKDNFIVRLWYDPSHDYTVGIVKLRELHLISVFVFLVSFLRDPILQRKRFNRQIKELQQRKINQGCQTGVINLYQILPSNSDHKYTAGLSSANWDHCHPPKMGDSKGAGAGTAFRMNSAQREEYTRSSADWQIWKSCENCGGRAKAGGKKTSV